MTNSIRSRKPNLIPDNFDTHPKPNSADCLKTLGLGGQPEMLRVADVARLLEISCHCVYNLLHSGELSGVRISPRNTRIFRDSLAEYIRRRLV